jgi:protein tyrosine/serine phosphatase
LQNVSNSKVAVPDLRQALESFLDREGLPAMVHCTQGKDRTGIIVMLALMILCVPENAIEYDYELSEEGLAAEKESRLAEIRAIGLSDDFGGVAEDMMATVRGHLDAKYGGLEKYLDNIGFGQTEREKLRNRLTY